MLLRRRELSVILSGLITDSLQTTDPNGETYFIYNKEVSTWHNQVT